MGKGSTERGGRTDVRQRRAFQRLGQDPFSTLGIEAGDGIVLDGALGTISIDLATDPGLAFSSGDLTVIVGDGLVLTVTGVEIDLAASGGLAFSSGDLTIDLRDTTPALELTANGIGVLVGNGLELTATGVEVDLLASGGLAFSTGDLTIDLRDTTPALELTANGVGVIVGNGLELTATGVEIDLAMNPGLAFSTGDLTVLVGNGLELTLSGVEVDLAATSPGLEFSSGDLRVKVKAAGGITRDADGLSQTQVSDSGTYTPTITNKTNVTTSSTHVGLWTRQGNIVMVTVRVNITPTAAGVNTDVLISVPVTPTNKFDGSFEAFGLGNNHNTPDDGLSGVLFSEAGAFTVRFRYKPTVAGSVHGFYITFQYNIFQ